MGWDGDLWLSTCLLSRDGGKGSHNQCKGTDYMVIYPAPHGPYHLSGNVGGFVVGWDTPAWLARLVGLSAGQSYAITRGWKILSNREPTCT